MRSGLLLVVSLLLAWGITDWVRKIALRFNLIYYPDIRSSHTSPTPLGGGLGIVLTSSIIGLGLVLSLVPIHSQEREIVLILAVLGLALALAVVGLADDIRRVSVQIRFGLQVVVCSGLLLSLGGMPGISFIPATLQVGGGFEIGGWMLSGLLLLAGVWWINLFNFMDGIDGIAGVQAILMLLAGAGLAVWAQPDVVSSIAWIWKLCIAAATAGFLIPNWPPAKIFMGDAGSTWLGFVIFALALFSVQSGWLDYAVWLVLGALFVTDATVTLVRRMLAGDRWYEAHCSHAYQHLARRWAGHRPVTIGVIAINVLWLMPLAWACLAWQQWTWVWLLLAYLPLVAGAVMLGAGRPERVPGARMLRPGRVPGASIIKSTWK